MLLLLLQVCRPLGIPVIINDRVDVALVTDADGVHVGQSDIPAAAVRKMLGPNKILGVSVKTPAEAVQAEADGADYLGSGAVYFTGTKASDVIGVEGFREVCQATRLPVVSIGGVGASNAGETLAVGAAGVAVVSAVFGAPDVAAATRELREVVDNCLRQQQQQQQRDKVEDGVMPAAAVVG
jgi:hydroxymethylpyrimidine kinase/phosphomethylpyrimidine kinase/thiamine-phosphate diphosphorylase